MGRIRHTHIHVYLFTTGYAVECSVFDGETVIHREAYDRLTWREAEQVIDAVADAYRPGLELMVGGTQLPLF